MLQAVTNCCDGVNFHSAHGERAASRTGAAWARRRHSGLIGCAHLVWHRSLHPHARRPAHVRRPSSSVGSDMLRQIVGRRQRVGRDQSTATLQGLSNPTETCVEIAASLPRALTGCRSAAAATLVALRNCASCLCLHFLARCEPGTNGASTSWPAKRSEASRPESQCG